jgi:thiol-disulfide isomerase/thioredoxin
MGYLIVQHRLGRYCSIYNPNNNRSFNLGIFDKANLGEIDMEDIISLSYDQYFKPSPNRFSCKLQDSIIVNFESTNFLIEWLGAYQVKYKLIDANQHFELPIIYLDENLADFTIEELGLQLSSQLMFDRTLINFWAGFCPPCIATIPKLNELGEQVIGFQLDKEDRSINEVHFRNHSISNETLTFLGINGFPNYLVIDRNMRILYSGRNADDAIRFLNERN